MQLSPSYLSTLGGQLWCTPLLDTDLGRMDFFHFFFFCAAYLCELHVGWVPQNGAVWLLVASIADELGIPDSEVVLAIRPLGEYGDSRPERNGWEGAGISDVKGSSREGMCSLRRLSGVAWDDGQPLPAFPLCFLPRGLCL